MTTGVQRLRADGRPWITSSVRLRRCWTSSAADCRRTGWPGWARRRPRGPPCAPITIVGTRGADELLRRPYGPGSLEQVPTRRPRRRASVSCGVGTFGTILMRGFVDDKGKRSGPGGRERERSGRAGAAGLVERGLDPGRARLFVLNGGAGRSARSSEASVGHLSTRPAVCEKLRRSHSRLGGEAASGLRGLDVVREIGLTPATAVSRPTSSTTLTRGSRDRPPSIAVGRSTHLVGTQRLPGTRVPFAERGIRTPIRRPAPRCRSHRHRASRRRPPRHPALPGPRTRPSWCGAGGGPSWKKVNQRRSVSWSIPPT